MPEPALGGAAYLFAAMYHVDGEFSNLRKFVTYFRKYLEYQPFNWSSVETAIERICGDLGRHDGIKSNQDAFHVLATEELGKVIKTVDSQTRKEIEEAAPTEALLRTTCSFGVSALSELALEVSPPNIHVVDAFPTPYDASPVSALAVEGNNSFDLAKTGIYFLKRDLRPYYSSFLLLHELIHFAAADGESTIARGLEEGIAEIMGALYLASKYFGSPLTRRIFTYNRLFESDHTLWDLYLDYTRQAGSLYLTSGINGLIEVLRDGRARIKAIEKTYSHGSLPGPHPSPAWHPELTNLVHSLVFGSVPNMVVSATAKYVSKYVKADTSVRAIVNAAGIDKCLGESAIEELAQSARLIVLSPDLTVVTHSDCELAQHALRYSVPPGVEAK